MFGVDLAIIDEAHKGAYRVSRIRKRFEKMLNNPVDIRWDELQPILRHYDCIVDKGSKGSH